MPKSISKILESFSEFQHEAEASRAKNDQMAGQNRFYNLDASQPAIVGIRDYPFSSRPVLRMSQTFTPDLENTNQAKF